MGKDKADRKVIPLDLDRLLSINPLPIRANDPRVLVNGKPLPVDFRIITEENYQASLRTEREMYEKLKQWR